MTPKLRDLFVPIRRGTAASPMPERENGDAITQIIDVPPCPRCNATRAIRYKLRGLSCRGCGHPRKEEFV